MSKPFYKKLNDGKFSLFPGVTYISFLNTHSKALLSKVYSKLQTSPLITDYYALLPVESYHMTAIPICNAMNTPTPDFHEYILNELAYFQKFHQHTEYPEQEIKIIVSNSRCNHVIQLIVDIPEALKKIINDVAEKTNLIDEVPKHFHITLGYQKKYGNHYAPQLIENIVEHYIEEALSESEDRSLIIVPPQLCYYKSMEQFTPWDCSSSPFEQLENTTTSHNRDDIFFQSRQQSTSSIDIPKKLQNA